MPKNGLSSDIVSAASDGKTRPEGAAFRPPTSPVIRCSSGVFGANSSRFQYEDDCEIASSAFRQPGRIRNQRSDARPRCRARMYIVTKTTANAEAHNAALMLSVRLVEH